MRGTNRSILRFFILSLLTAGLLLCSAPLCSTRAADSDTAGSSVGEMMAGLSDEQVRQLLIEELKKDAQVDEPDPQKMKGPALLFSRLLRAMSNEHDESEDEVRALFSSLPLLGPDLYRVFVKL